MTQLFYVSNMYHDLLHTLGFNGAAGNFETRSSGGRGNDEVILNTQDGELSPDAVLPSILDIFRTFWNFWHLY